jgi:ribonucleoside-triphosphate reductase
MEVAAQAHLEKRVFLEKLLALGDKGPLAALATRRSGSPLVKLGWTTLAICIVGLDELCRTVVQSGIHESEEAREFATKVLSHVKHEAERLSNKHNTRFTLNSQASESACRRLAQLDVRFFGDTPGEAAGGTTGSTAACYTDGVRLPQSSGLDLNQRIRAEGAFHRIGLRNAATEVRLGEGLTFEPETLSKVLVETLQDSACSALVFQLPTSAGMDS